MSTVESYNVVKSQIQTVFGMDSHLVARNAESKLQSIIWTPVGGPDRPTLSKVLC
jgi:hypothetical protein